MWGFHKAPDIEKIHLDFCKNILGVKSSTPNAMVYCELGRLPLYCIRKCRIIKYWLKLSMSNNCILKSCYEYLNTSCEQNNCKNWLYNVKNILSEIGLLDVWINQNIYNHSYILATVKQRVYDICIQSLISDINNSSKCKLYSHLIDQITLQPYLCKPIFTQYKKWISKIRLSSHCLTVETGRYKNVPINRRFCPVCPMDIEDEFHFSALVHLL